MSKQQDLVNNLDRHIGKIFRRGADSVRIFTGVTDRNGPTISAVCVEYKDKSVVLDHCQLQNDDVIIEKLNNLKSLAGNL